MVVSVDNPYARVVSELPLPPSELLDSLKDITEKYHNYHPKEWHHVVSSYGTNPKLEEFYQQYFEYPIVCRYQLIFRDLPPHIDAGLDGLRKHNLLLDTGGDNVETYFWSSLDGGDENLLYKCVCDENVWYDLNVGIPHGISSIDRCRFSLVIRQQYTKLDPEYNDN